MQYVRTQVYFEPGQHRALREEAHRRGVSLARLLRDFVDEKLGRDRKQKGWDLRPLIGILGSGEPTDIGRYQDDYMDQAMREHYERKTKRP